jgi:hypothetical protein
VKSTPRITGKSTETKMNVKETVKTEQMPLRTARVDRAEDVAKSRRRRRESSYFDGADFNLMVPEEEKDQRYVYRWINDDKYRLNQMTKQDDWDICNVSEFSSDFKNTDGGTQVSRIVGRDAHDGIMRAFLCKKLKEYEDADRAKELRRINEMYTQMREGQIPGRDSLSRENEELRYVPKEVHR